MNLIDSDGLETLTVARLAKQLGIKAPSLYKRFSGIGEILQGVERHLFSKLEAALKKAVKDNSRASLLSACRAHRKFAKQNANLYPLLFSQSHLDEVEATELRYRTAAPILQLFSNASPDIALKKARTITAFVHGYVAIEIANGFQMGGNVDAAFEYGAKLLVDSLLQD